MEKEIEVNGKKFMIKEIPYIEVVDVNTENRKEIVLKMFKASLGLNEEEIGKLTLREGREIERAIAEINGINLEDFQKPAEKSE